MRQMNGYGIYLVCVDFKRGSFVIISIYAYFSVVIRRAIKLYGHELIPTSKNLCAHFNMFATQGQSQYYILFMFDCHKILDFN